MPIKYSLIFLLLTLSGYTSAWADPKDDCIELLQNQAKAREQNLKRATKLVAKIQSESTISDLAKGVPIDFENSEIMIIFSSTDLGKIREGGFKNVHETRASSYSDDEEIVEYIRYRKGLENSMANAKSTPKNILPKYAIVQGYDPPLVRRFVDEGFGMAGDEGIEPYGGVAAVLKGDVKSRTTFTLFDSLAMYGDLEEPARSLALRENLRTFKKGTQKIDFDEGDIDYRYIEAQIWGPLDLSDVSHFIINPGTSEYRLSGDVLRAITEQLLPAGKPIYLGKSMDTPLKEIFPYLELEDESEKLQHLGYLLQGQRLD